MKKSGITSNIAIDSLPTLSTSLRIVTVLKKIYDGEPNLTFFSNNTIPQGCGSGLDPDSIRSVDPDPNSESGSGSRRAKMTHKSRIFFLKFMLKSWMPSVES
jgi:hypothetical protein